MMNGTTRIATILASVFVSFQCGLSLFGPIITPFLACVTRNIAGVVFGFHICASRFMHFFSICFWRKSYSQFVRDLTNRLDGLSKHLCERFGSAHGIQFFYNIKNAAVCSFGTNFSARCNTRAFSRAVSFCWLVRPIYSFWLKFFSAYRALDERETTGFIFTGRRTESWRFFTWLKYANKIFAAVFANQKSFARHVILQKGASRFSGALAEGTREKPGRMENGNAPTVLCPQHLQYNMI